MEKHYFARRYTQRDEILWDKFVECNSVNGTFLQTRRFLNYHPKDRFEDYSIIIEDAKGHIAAVCPACRIIDNSGNHFISHKGSTFGGLVIADKHYYAHKVIEIIGVLENLLKEQGFSDVELRTTPMLFSMKDSSLLEYSLFYCGYQEFCELNTYIDFRCYKELLISNFEQGKRTNIHNCIKKGLFYRVIETKAELDIFYSLLCKSLSKYNTKPVHSLSELWDLKHHRLNKEMEFYGAFSGEQMVAGAMMFYFYRTEIAHTQYLCAEPSLHKLSPMTYMYFAMIEAAKIHGFKKISFGISTEDNGKFLNYGLVRSKEAYGGMHSLNHKYFKHLNT